MSQNKGKNMNNAMHQKHSEELLKLKQEIIEDTIHNLLTENNGIFDLNTDQGINVAVDYMVDYLMINRIEVNSINLKEKLIRCLPKSKA